MAFDDELVEVVGLGCVEWFEREVVEDQQVDSGQFAELAGHEAGDVSANGPAGQLGAG